MRPTMLFLAPLLAAAFLLGHVTGRPSEASAKTNRAYTGRLGEVFLVPAAATRCVVSAEAGATNVTCAHTPTARARYSVVFYRDNLFVYRYGKPDNPVFSAQGRP